MNPTATSITTLAEAKKAQWGVQTSTTAIDLLDKIKPDKDPKVFQSLSDAYAALAGQAGRRGPHRHRDQPR